MTVLEYHYLSQGCFLKENEILDSIHLLEDSLKDGLKSIPCEIIQGRFDFVCPVYQAYELHKALPNSRLSVVSGGHSAESCRCPA